MDELSSVISSHFLVKLCQKWHYIDHAAAELTDLKHFCILIPFLWFQLCHFSVLLLLRWWYMPAI